MAATARREIDTGEEDIAAIAKQISDHAEAIYQTWKARGLAPTEILSCRPTPGIKLAESLRTKPRPEPKPEIKQRPELRREHRPEIREQRPDVRREQRVEPRLDLEPEGIEMMLPPDLVPERSGAAAGNARRADQAAMRLEVAREEERLLRALRTGGVVAERNSERPDVVPPISLVDYAKSRYQDRLDTGARKPSTGASGERRASLGSHVTEARSKFEARARRASSAGAGEPASASGATPVRPFLTRGSVAERVLMFERCPSEATLELAKRKSPAATTWRGPHDVINRAQQKSMPLTKEEVMQLVQLVEANPVIFSKATNATNNQLKDAAWITITDQFNALIASIPRKPEQLRLKWENLKKAARKRSTKIRMNNIKTGGGKPEYIPPDDALDKIAAILGATCDGYTVKFGGDAVVEVEEGISTAVEEFVVVEDHLGSDPTMPIPPKEVPLASTSSQQTPKSKFLFSSVGSKGKLKRQAITEEVKESIRDRNRAIADYYNSKRKQEEEYNVLKKRKLELEILEMEKNLSNS